MIFFAEFAELPIDCYRIKDRKSQERTANNTKEDFLRGNLCPLWNMLKQCFDRDEYRVLA